ncbi:transposable element Tcb1 transposase [Trichonephila clavipes]|uniref:Transposable element Tcb1 transposase n=1 Tax=Trichonephila clavipes TaxID=2585209 RepID=A0A8X6S461_TRICX|nr:transposable element Tcb1 transposase [Trichonephila clavipes]
MWTGVDFSVMMVAVDLGSQQIGRTEIDCQISRHNASFIVINQQTCEPHTSVHPNDRWLIEQKLRYLCHSHLKPDCSNTWLLPVGILVTTTLYRRHSENCSATVPFAVPWPHFSEDKTRSHAALVAMNCLTVCQTLPWPARSPDLSPIQHLCDMMGRRLHLPENVDDLAQQLEQV